MLILEMSFWQNYIVNIGLKEILNKRKICIIIYEFKYQIEGVGPLSL